MLPPKKLLDQVRDTLRLKNYDYWTEKSYLHWIKQYILFHNKRHPNEMGAQRSSNFSPIWLPTEKLPHQLKTRP
jgi:hypothetical protein